MTAPTDRRVRRTRASITDAFIGLVLEHGYDRTTVQDILNRADVGRSTFYTHFRDKESVLLSCFADLREGLGAALAATTGQATTGQVTTTGPVPTDPWVPT